MGMPVICASKTSFCQAKIDIMESIALQEAALAHILNAEGEKLQRFVACADKLDDILCANKSVEETIKAISCLEESLFCKLKMVMEDDCDCCHKRYCHCEE